MKLNASSMGFALMNNVEVTVIDKETCHIKKTFTTHNKATRSMVRGILHFVEGKFTETSLRNNPLHDDEVPRNFIPCYFGFGDGGVEIKDGIPQPYDNVNTQYPKLEDGWTETVDYLSTHLVREFHTPTPLDENPTGSLRYRLRKQEDTLDQSYDEDMYKTITDKSSLSMDSLYFYCETPVSELNQEYNMHNVYVTELGLFAGQARDKNDLLAYVKLNNIKDDNGDVIDSNVLYVTPRDTVIINWVITIAAIGKDNILTASHPGEDGSLEPIVVDNIKEIPEGHYIAVEEYPITTNGGNE